MLSPNGFVDEFAVSNTGFEAVPSFSIYIVCPSYSPIKASRSPSPSISANSGDENRPTSSNPKGLLEEFVLSNAGVEEDPVFSRKMIFPSPFPKKTSRSPSLSRSANSGTALLSTFTSPFGLVTGESNVMFIAKELSISLAVSDPGVPLNSSAGRKRIFVSPLK